MAGVRIQEAASHRLDNIYRYTRDRWGAEQADVNGGVKVVHWAAQK